MNSIDLFLFLFACAGITFTIVHAEILDIWKIRPFIHKIDFFKKLTSCSLCTGFWTGLFVSIIFYPETENYILLAFASSAFSFLFERSTILMDEKIIQLESKRLSE